MPRPIHVALAAVPAALAALIAVLLLSQTGLPSSALNPNDDLEIEYTRQQLFVTEGIPARITASQTEILLVRADGSLVYTGSLADGVQSEEHGSINATAYSRIAAMIKETGFLAIGEGQFAVRDGTPEYTKYTVMVVLNGQETRLSWPGQNATVAFIPPILDEVRGELDRIMDGMQS